jgi:hypothetical protein
MRILREDEKTDSSLDVKLSIEFGCRLVSKSNDGAWILTPTSGVEAGDVTSHQVIAILLTSGGNNSSLLVLFKPGDRC